MIFIKPKTAVGKQEVYYIRLAVIEAAAIPGRVPAFFAVVEILVVGAVEKRKPITLVFHCMGMDEIHDYSKPKTMSRIYEAL